jgi:hypothetical protein
VLPAEKEDLNYIIDEVESRGCSAEEVMGDFFEDF